MGLEKSATQGIRMSVVTIGPEEARQFLSNNPNNRSIQASTVNSYAEEMKAGRWDLNGETIKISRSGTLLDGQHRLTAVVKTGVAVPFAVIYGLPDKVFGTIDRGRKRTLSNVLGMAGVKDSPKVAAVAKRLLHWENTRDKSLFSFTSDGFSTMRDSAILDYAEVHLEEIQSAVAFLSNSLPFRKCQSGSALATAMIICQRYDAERTEIFFDQLRTGHLISPRSPIGALRERLLSPPGRHGLSWDLEIMALTIKAFGKFLSNQPSSLIRWSREGDNTEKFPVLGKSRW